MQLSVCQQKGLDEFEAFLISDDKEFILSGFSGVGKTYLTELLINKLQTRNKFMRDVLQVTPYALALTATTNKAVKVLHTIVEKLDLGVTVGTIHSYLKLRVRQDTKTGNEFISKTNETKLHRNNIVFIDEASYIDSPLLKIIRECFSDSKIVYIGDRDQLLAVNYQTSPVFESDRINKKVHMITPQRNQGSINLLGHSFRNVLHGADFPVIKETDEIQFLTGSQFKQKVIESFTSDEYKTDPNYCRILGWTNRKVLQYNQFIRELYTATQPYVAGEYLTSNSVVMGGGDAILLSSDTTLRISDVTIVQTDHQGIDYQDISFDDCEHVLRVPLDYNQVKYHLNQFAKAKDWIEFFNLKNHYADMRPAHACTVHKSQGSTYHTAYLDLSDIGSNNKPLEVARLMYVATTRAKTKLYLYGSLPEKYTGKL